MSHWIGLSCPLKEVRVRSWEIEKLLDCIYFVLYGLYHMNNPFAVCSLHMTLSGFRHKNSWAMFLLRMLDLRPYLWGICWWTWWQNAGMVLLCEVLVDVIKHSFLAKFNEIKPEAYSEFLQALCKQVMMLLIWAFWIEFICIVNCIGIMDVCGMSCTDCW